MILSWFLKDEWEGVNEAVVPEREKPIWKYRGVTECPGMMRNSAPKLSTAHPPRNLGTSPDPSLSSSTFIPSSVAISLSFFFSFIFISWRLITLQYYSGFCHTLTWINHGFTCVPHPDPLPPPSPSHSSGSSQCTRPEHLSQASNLGWWSVSPLTVYLFQCCSLRTSHPCLLPQSPKVCSVHLCLFFCFAYRVIVTIFLNSIYMC